MTVDPGGAFSWNVVLDPPGAMWPAGVNTVLGTTSVNIPAAGSLVTTITLTTPGTTVLIPVGAPIIITRGSIEGDAVVNDGGATMVLYPKKTSGGGYVPVGTTVFDVFDVFGDAVYANTNYPGGSLVMIASRIPLDINNSGYLEIDQKGIDWGDAAVSAYEADTLVGSVSVGSRTPNRVVRIPLILSDSISALTHDQSSEEVARAMLTQKVALLQREGGCLLRQRGAGSRMYADVETATLGLPDVYGETGAIEPDVVLTLECLPDFYGDEFQLDNVSATGVYHAPLTYLGQPYLVQGDSASRVDFVVTNDSGNDQQSLLWGVRSRYYDPASTARLFYEAEALSPIGNATIATSVAPQASPSGSTSDNVVSCALAAGSWVPVLLTDIAGETSLQLTHQGSYQVYVRALFPSGQSPPVLRLGWGLADVANPIYNTMVQMPNYPSTMVLINLGQVRLDRAPMGTHGWRGLIQAMAAANGDEVVLDAVYLQPLDEFSGQLRASPPQSVLAVSASAYAGSAATSGSGTAWANVDLATGPPANDFAGCTVTSSTSSQLLKLEGFGFDVPSGATILGIYAVVTHLREGTGGDCYDAAVELLQSGTAVGSNYANPAILSPSWPPTVDTYGGANDLWGATWTPAEVNAIGIQLSTTFDTPDGATQTVYIDSAQLTVYYSLAGVFTPADDAVVFASRTVDIRTDGMYRKSQDGTLEGAVSTVVGDLPRLPPAGLEGRTTEVFVKPCFMEPGADPNTSTDYIVDDSLDAFAVQTVYRLTWISRP